MRLPARIYGFFLAFFLIIFIPKVSFAQISTEAQQYQTPDVNSNVPKNLHFWTQNVMLEVMSSMICQLAGINPINPNQECLGVDRQTGKIGFVKNGGGAIGVMGNMIGVLYTPPIHTADYFNYLASNFGIAKDANAQGVGLTSVKPISGLWVTFRNIVYLLFVLIFILIGLGIMLRVRIDPRTVMTVQNQIPKIIIGLIFVTFSFAIAGFLIDAMWFVSIVIINILTSVHPQLPLNQSTYVTPFGLSDVLGGFFGVGLQSAGAIGGGIYKTLNTNSLSPVLAQLPTSPECALFDLGCALGTLFSTTIGGLVNQVIGIVFGFLVGIFVFLVVMIAIIWALFKLWFALISAYISILIDIIFAPFWIIGGLLPGAGNGIGFGAWVRDLAANLMAFPVVIGLFLIGRIIADGFTTTTANNTFFTPPLIGDPTGSGLGALIAFGIIMISPNVVKMTKAAFKSSSIDTRSIEQGIGVGQVVATAGTSRLWRGMTRPAGGGASAGPLRVGAAYLLATTRKEATIHDKANAVRGRWYNLGGRLNRYRVAQGLIGKQAKPSVESAESGGAAK